MKTCNNCNTTNEVTAEKCMHCNMPGNFTLHAVATEAMPLVEKEQTQCRNCGSLQPGEGHQCTQCRFPLPHAFKNPVSKMAVHVNRKVG